MWPARDGDHRARFLYHPKGHLGCAARLPGIEGSGHWNRETLIRIALQRPNCAARLTEKGIYHEKV